MSNGMINNNKRRQSMLSLLITSTGINLYFESYGIKLVCVKVIFIDYTSKKKKKNCQMKIVNIFSS